MGKAGEWRDDVVAQSDPQNRFGLTVKRGQTLTTIANSIFLLPMMDSPIIFTVTTATDTSRKSRIRRACLAYVPTFLDSRICI
jgi:hypothetical protein